MRTFRDSRQLGFTLLEVLITLLVMAFGILGLANLQGKMHLAETESYQRAQALILMEDMASRINANRFNAASYVTGTANPLGVGDTQPTSCTSLAIGQLRDQCEWSNALKGASETRSGSNVGAMIGARGCIQLVQAADPSVGVCAPAIYRVTVAWQGLNRTVVPSLTCGQNLYGGAANDNYRRVVSSLITIGLPSCT